LLVCFRWSCHLNFRWIRRPLIRLKPVPELPLVLGWPLVLATLLALA
jgi:hypothetical protein